jgi:hypothetical protein
VEDYVGFPVESGDGRVVEFIDFTKKNYPEQATVKEVVEEHFEDSVDLFNYEGDEEFPLA